MAIVDASRPVTDKGIWVKSPTPRVWLKTALTDGHSRGPLVSVCWSRMFTIKEEIHRGFGLQLPRNLVSYD